MPLKFGSTTIENVYWEEYSGGAAMYVPIEKIIFNGTTVFQKIETITETVSIPFNVYGSQSGVSFYYPKSGLMKATLKHTPIKVTSFAQTTSSIYNFTITNNLSGTVKFKGTQSTSTFNKSGTWSISGNTFTIIGPDSVTSNNNSFGVTITYQYYA